MPENNSHSNESLISERSGLNEERMKVEEEFRMISERRNALIAYHGKLSGAAEILTKLIGDTPEQAQPINIPVQEAAADLVE